MIDKPEVIFDHWQQMWECAAYALGVPVGFQKKGLLEVVLNREINPGKLLDVTLPLEQLVEGDRAMETPRKQGASAAMSKRSVSKKARLLK